MLNAIKRLINEGSPSWLNTFLWLPLRRLLYRARIRAVLWRGRRPVVVYQMGKVASKTIYATLEQVAAVQPFHTHLLSPANMQRRRPEKERVSGKTSAENTFIVWRLIYETLIHNYTGPVQIVTLVREPIGRNISAFFQGLDKRTGIRASHIHAPVSLLQERFLRDYPHTRPLTWFDEELLDVTGIDVYQHPFPKEQGFQRIRQGRFDVLIMRHDLPDDTKASCLSEFLEIPGIRIVRDNEAENKDYRDCYREFQKTIQLGPEYVETMLESKYARHFFPDAEREKLRRKWLRQEQPARPAESATA